jgi:hypothetical protein
VSTISLKNTLSVYIVNGISGKVVYKFSVENVSPEHPIDMILLENQFVLSYKRQSFGIPKQELTVTEFFSSKEETDTMKLLKDFYLHGEKRLTSHEFSSYQMEAPVVIQESFLLTLDVKKICLTQSMQHVTSKSLVIITSNDQVYTLESAMFTARRQTKEEAEQVEARKLEIATTIGPVTRNETDTLLDLKSTNYPPYDGVIP